MKIAFDGNVYTGKTTLIRLIADRKGFAVAGEYSSFLKTPETETKDYLEMQRKYLDAEEKRSRSIRQKKEVLLDRSILSQAAHIYALHRLDVIDIRKEFLRELEAKIMKNAATLPDVFIHIHCPYQKAKSRLEAGEGSKVAKGTLDYLSAKDYFDLVNEFHERCYGLLSTISIDTSGDEEECAEKIICAIERKRLIKTSVFSAIKRVFSG